MGAMGDRSYLSMGSGRDLAFSALWQQCLGALSFVFAVGWHRR